MEETRDELEIVRRKISRHRATITTIAIVVVVLCVIICAIVYYYNKNKTFSSYEVNDNMKMENEIDATFYRYGNLLLKSSPDGITYYEMGKMIWTQSFEIKNPVFDICKSYTAVAQRNTNTIYIFSTEGIQATINSQNPIKKLKVASQGVVALVSEEDSVNYVEVLDKKGNSLAVGKTVLSGDGYPLDIDISEDGEKLIVSYLYLSDGEPRSRVAFYNFSEVGQNEIDNLVGGYNYKETVVGDVEFVNETTAVAVGDNKITVFEIEQKPSIVKTIVISENIMSAFYSNEYIGLILDNNQSDKPYQLRVYDLSGDIVLDKAVTINYTKVKFDGQNVLLYNEAKCQIISLKGVIKFEYSFETGIRDILTTDNEYEYIFVKSDKIEEVELD